MFAKRAMGIYYLARDRLMKMATNALHLGLSISLDGVSKSLNIDYQDEQCTSKSEKSRINVTYST